MAAHSTLFTPVTIGNLAVPNRILMAPLTRNRAKGDGVPGDLAARYYHQRASSGLIFSEATQISAIGKGYLDTPGIYTDAQVAGWRAVTDAVHAGGGRIFCQLWHVGRISHVSLLPEGQSPVSATDQAAEAQTFTAAGFEACSKPVALTEEGIAATLADYAHAAACAKRAGFDGVEVHAANGYLLDQFLQDGVNTRSDRYGGSVENRMRFMMEAIDAVETVFPRERVGVRLSPLGQANDMSDSDREAHFGAIYGALSQRELAYLHVVEEFPGGQGDAEARAVLRRLRPAYGGVYIANGDYDAESAAKAISEGHADAVSFGRLYIANPDLPERFRRDAPLNTPDADTFYGGGAEGYTDYPFLTEETAVA